MRLVVPVLFVLFIFTPSISYSQEVIWFNGVLSSLGGLSSELNTFQSEARVYDDFDVVPDGYDVHELFASFLWNDEFVGNRASWEIRSGMRVGEAGRLLASGIQEFDAVATGVVTKDFSEFFVTVDIPDLFLPGGKYWLNIALIGQGAGQALVSSTVGNRSVGSPGGTMEIPSFMPQTLMSIMSMPRILHQRVILPMGSEESI